jgi:hypothetical protein
LRLRTSCIPLFSATSSCPVSGPLRSAHGRLLTSSNLELRLLSTKCMILNGRSREEMTQLELKVRLESTLNHRLSMAMIVHFACKFQLKSHRAAQYTVLHRTAGDEIIFVTRRMRLPCHRPGISLHSPSLAHKPLTRPRPHSD